MDKVDKWSRKFLESSFEWIQKKIFKYLYYTVNCLWYSCSAWSNPKVNYKNEAALINKLNFHFSINANTQNNSIDALLDGLHRDAHEGNFQSYFARYSPDAIFGTDKTERWTIEDFKAYAKPAFEDGHGWTFSSGTTEEMVISAVDEVL